MKRKIENMLRARRLLQIERERDVREKEIAQCSCGAQVRKNLDGVWVHCGPCKFDEGY